ncbi:hypothetical protein DSM106972_011120 [Dulcicalothrix desertica PCC 7102]|uniref:DUF433 domain-containing protein n=1 Tax=Dulcicalothrix desertica PCC 7102 TaxID=232991 RepID=A0A3S1CUV6_9CYAN|nr:DUF433 domain-containing protein [Dulcicalothrix desertica]RUT09059.1 hypothetical protein DSM106972_011120 [Dulcicalothrix desertica PCC 7102]
MAAVHQIKVGDACIKETRIPVWLLVSYHSSGLSEAKILDNYPTLSDVDARKCLVLRSSICK